MAQMQSPVRRLASKIAEQLAVGEQVLRMAKGERKGRAFSEGVLVLTDARVFFLSRGSAKSIPLSSIAKVEMSNHTLTATINIRGDESSEVIGTVNKEDARAFENELQRMLNDSIAGADVTHPTADSRTWRQTPDGQWQYLGKDGNWYNHKSEPPRLAPSAWAVPTSDHQGTVPAGGWLAIIAGAAIAIGSLLPWESVSAVLGVSLSRNGFQLGANSSFSVDGLACVFLGVVVALIGITRLTRSSMPPLLAHSPILPGLAALGLTIYDAHRVQQLIDSAKAIASGGTFTGSIGYGLWMAIVGAGLAVIAGLVLRQRA